MVLRKMEVIHVRNNIAKTAAIAAATLLQGCEYFQPGNIEMEQYVSYSSDYDGDELVLNGYITIGHGVYAEVSHTVRPEAKMSADTVCDATVSLLEDGRVIATLHANPGRRLSLNYAERFMFFLLPGEVTLAEGRKYSLRAESPTRGQAESEPDVMPSLVEIDEIWADTSYWGSYTAFHATYHGADDGARVCGFMRSFRHQACHTACGFYSLLDTSEPHNGSGVVSAGNNGLNRYTDSVSVEVVTISPEMGKYLKSRDDYDDSKEDDTYETPMPVYENVSGGYGFVGTYAVSAATLIANDKNSVIDTDFWDDDIDDGIDIEDYMPVEWLRRRSAAAGQEMAAGR